MNKKYTDAAKSLASNPAYLLVKESLIDQLADPSLSILDKPDSVIAKAHSYEQGIRNFFRWVERAAQGSDQQDLDQSLRPFEHYTQENINTK